MSIVNRRRVVLGMLSIALLATTLLIVYNRQRLMTGMAEALIAHDAIENADLIVIVSGGLPEIRYGVDLYHQGLASKILFLGSYPVTLAVVSTEPFAVVEESWEVVAGHLARNAGVADDAILLSETVARSTYERAEIFLESARQVEAKQLIVVSDPLHTRRLQYSVGKLLGDDDLPAIAMAPTPPRFYPPAYRFDPETWWRNENDIKYVFEEYVKMAYYLLKY